MHATFDGHIFWQRIWEDDELHVREGICHTFVGICKQRRSENLQELTDDYRSYDHDSDDPAAVRVIVHLYPIRADLG